MKSITVAIAFIVGLSMVQSTPTRRLPPHEDSNFGFNADRRASMPLELEDVNEEKSGLKLKRLLKPTGLGDGVSEYKFPVFFIPGGKPKNFVKVKSMKKSKLKHNKYFKKS